MCVCVTCEHTFKFVFLLQTLTFLTFVSVLLSHIIYVAWRCHSSCQSRFSRRAQCHSVSLFWPLLLFSTSCWSIRPDLPNAEHELTATADAATVWLLSLVTVVHKFVCVRRPDTHTFVQRFFAFFSFHERSKLSES